MILWKKLTNSILKNELIQQIVEIVKFFPYLFKVLKLNIISNILIMSLLFGLIFEIIYFNNPNRYNFVLITLFTALSGVLASIIASLLFQTYNQYKKQAFWLNNYKFTYLRLYEETFIIINGISIHFTIGSNYSLDYFNSYDKQYIINIMDKLYTDENKEYLCKIHNNKVPDFCRKTQIAFTEIRTMLIPRILDFVTDKSLLNALSLYDAYISGFEQMTLINKNAIEERNMNQELFNSFYKTAYDFLNISQALLEIISEQFPLIDYLKEKYNKQPITQIM